MIRPIRNIFSGRYSLLFLSALFFLLTLFFGWFYANQSVVGREQRHAARYIQERQQDFHAVLKDTALLFRLGEHREAAGDFNRMTGKPYGIFLYEIVDGQSPRMLFWNKQLAIPPDALLAAKDGVSMQRLSNGWYMAEKATLLSGLRAWLAVALVPVQSHFFIETEYLPERFYFSRTAQKMVRISEHPNDYPVKDLSGTTLFYLERKIGGAVSFNDTVTNLLRLAGVLFLLLFIYRFSFGLIHKRGGAYAIGWLTAVLFLLRLSTYLFPFLLNLRQFEFFSPLIYGSSLVQRSLGDLLVNAALFCWVVLFAWPLVKKWEDPLARFSPRFRWIGGGLAGFLFIFSTFKMAALTRSLVADSKVSFDVTDFFSLNIYTVAGLFVLALLALTYFHFSQLLFRFMDPLVKGRDYLLYFVLGLAGLLYLSIGTSRQDVLFFLPVLLWLLLYTWLIHNQAWLASRFRINLAGMLWWIFIFSASISVIMLAQNEKVERTRRKAIAEKLAVQTDPSSEMMMSIAVKYLDDNFLSGNFHRFYNEEKGKWLRDSIIAGNYSGFLNKYDTRLYVYDSLNHPLFNEDPVTWEALNIIFTQQARPTATEGLYYYETAFDKFNYIIRRELYDSVYNRLGTFFIVSNLKNFSRDAIFPELFRKNKKAEPENSPTYANAVYIRGRLVSPGGNYPFATQLQEKEIPSEEFSHRPAGDYDELWYRASKDKLVVVARKRETTIETITLFSYIFCSFLVLVGLLQLVIFLLRTGWSAKSLRRFFQLNIRSQVHTTILFISVFSFLVIGAATISFFISRNRQSNAEKLGRTMKIMVNEMEKKMAVQNTFDDVIKVYDTVSVPGYGLQQLVDEVSDIHGVDVNVYDLEGGLRVSSEANVYTKGVLSKKMEPSAYYHLSRLRQVQYVQEEKVGNFSYLSIYAPVRNEEGVVEAYVNIPYFTARPELRQEISNFLVTVINLNAFIFLVAGLISLFVTNRITDSFSLISEKMREVNLGQKNEEISWNRSDEIGDLVKEYNKMVAKLGESARALAKSEREGAWREMARQVAHEIKNPLTPMKLGIQYLQKAIDNNQDNVKELTASVARTLVEQIDHLSRIAADFSQFANLGTVYAERFDLHQVIESLKELFASNRQVILEWDPVPGDVVVKADRTQMNRLFTNLLTNAVEAAAAGEPCRIRIAERREDGKLVVSITDYGSGIPPEVRERIFLPNFTTKSSGTGLGLAMCRGIVEQAKGDIWFETEMGKGTTFFVRLPLSEGSY